MTCRPECKPRVWSGFTKNLKYICFSQGSLFMSALLASYFLFYLPHFHRFASAPTTFLIADYNGTCEPTAYKNRRICISEGAARVDGSRSVTGSTGTSVSTRSSVSTTCSDSGDDDSAGITTTGLMCSDRADARRKLGGFCKKHNFNHYISLNFVCVFKKLFEC